MDNLESEAEDGEPVCQALYHVYNHPPDPVPLSYWASLKYTARWCGNRIVRTVTNVQKSVVEPYEMYDSIVRHILANRLLLPEDRSYVESVLNSETNFSVLDSNRRWPEAHRVHCLISALVTFAALLCLRRNSNVHLISLVAALGVTASKFISVSMLKLSVMQLTNFHSIQSSLLKLALVQIMDDESFHSSQHSGASTSSEVSSRFFTTSSALEKIESTARLDSEKFARNVFESLQKECLLWRAISVETRSAFIQDDAELLMPAALDDCKLSCPKLFQSEGIAESTDNFSYGAVRSLKTLNDLHRSECLRDICLALVQRCHLSLRSVFLCKKAIDSVVFLQADKTDFLCKEHMELKAKQSSLFTRLSSEYRSGSGKSRYSDCDASVRVLCVNLERCLQLATAIHYEIQQGQDSVGGAPSFDAVNELLEVLNSSLTQSVSFSADLQLRINYRRQQKRPLRLEGSCGAHANPDAENQGDLGTFVDLDSIPSGPDHDEIFVAKIEKNDESDCSQKRASQGPTFIDDYQGEASEAFLTPSVLSQLKHVLKAKEAERISREAAAMKRLGLEEIPSSESEEDDDKKNELEHTRSTGKSGFAPDIAAQAAARALNLSAISGAAGDEYVYDSSGEEDD